MQKEFYSISHSPCAREGTRAGRERERDESRRHAAVRSTTNRDIRNRGQKTYLLLVQTLAIAKFCTQ